MAVVIESSYGKTIGLPGYSSHKFALSIKTEVADLAQISGEAEKVYSLLQKAVDEQMVHSGFVPQGQNGTGRVSQTNGNRNGNGEHWNCSDKQRDLILKIVSENSLDKKEVDELARARFGVGVKELNKLSASGLIDELLEKYGGENPRRRNGGYSRRNAHAGRRR